MRFVVAASLFLVLACSRTEDAPVVVEAGPPAPPSVAAPAPSGGKPSRSQLGAFSRALAEGRALAHDRRWPEAIAAFEKALALEPDNVVVLNELGWAAVNAGDDAKARRYNTRALSAHPPPELEAQALYNEGRRLEALGKLDAARGFYERSLAARDNESVQSRLRTLGTSDAGVLPVADAGAPRASSLPCTSAPGDEAELRRCLEAYQAGQAPQGQAGEFVFGAEAPPSLPPATSLYRFGTRSPADGKTMQSTLVLVANTKAGLLPLAMLGTSYGTGEVKLASAEKKTATTWLVRSTVARVDQNLSGLEVREESSELLTACVVGPAPSCPVQVPVRLHSKLAYPNAADLDAAEQAVVQDRIRDLGPPFDRTTQLGAVLAGNALVVTLVSGKKEDVPHGVLGSHPLR